MNAGRQGVGTRTGDRTRRGDNDVAVPNTLDMRSGKDDATLEDRPADAGAVPNNGTVDLAVYDGSSRTQQYRAPEHRVSSERP